MKRKWRRVISSLFAVILAAMLVLSAANITFAEEGNGFDAVDEEQLDNSASYKVGDVIKFGCYEQDGNAANGKEEIEWEVLKIESDRMLVVSKYALDCKPYNTEYTDITWEACTLRQWLNNDFKNSAFSSAEQSNIPTVPVVNENNSFCGTEGGNDTQDQIFCLSIKEIQNLIGYNYYNDNEREGYSQKLVVEPTQYAINNGAEVYTIKESDYNSYLMDKGYTSDVIGHYGSSWWLRDPGPKSNSACVVYKFGEAGASQGNDVDNNSFAIRPALYINISAIIPQSVNPESIELDITTAVMSCGEEMNLTATLSPSDVTETDITWTSSKPEVATVTDGVVKALSAGKATITAKTINDLTATCEVTVEEENAYKVGDIIKFGHYEQDGNEENGKEEIEWEVLKVENGRVLMVSKYVLDCKPYQNRTIYESTKYDTWETCYLRKWLNDNFKNEAFSLEEQEKIPIVKVITENNSYFETPGGNNTWDQIFCLSLNEIEDLFGYSWYNDEKKYGYSEKLITEPTQYAINNGLREAIITSSDYSHYKLSEYGYTKDVIDRHACNWKLRTPSLRGTSSSTVIYDGYAGANPYYSNTIASSDAGVRPALYYNYSPITPKSVQLDKTSATMFFGETITLEASLAPADVTDPYIIWTSSNPSVAIVNDGIVKTTGKEEGVTTISAKTVNGLTATCDITVTAFSNSYKAGDIIMFGSYEQDGNTSNGKEAIEWEVLKVESGRALVVSKYVLDCQKYDQYGGYTTWEKCSLRKWLNNDFKNAAFTATEQSRIPTVTVINNNETASGRNTQIIFFV